MHLSLLPAWRPLFLSVVLVTLAGAAQAQIGGDRYAAIVQDARSGTTLMAANADELRHPASLTKMMTLYMLFEAMRNGRVALDSPILMSREAAAQPPSKLGIPAGSSLTVEQAILALVTRSANDVACAIGEFLGGGSEERFAQMMTLRARALGMTRTTFRNASGLPDIDQVTTARDMALLGRRLREDFPAQYRYFAAENFRFRGRVIWNHNRLLSEYEGTDGIKTGYVNDSGFNLVASVQRDGQRLVGVVFGGATSRERDRHMVEILDAAFSRLGVAPRDPMAMVQRDPPPRTGLGIVSAARADSLPQARGRLPAREGERIAAAPARPAARQPTRGTPVIAERRGRAAAPVPPSRLASAQRAAPIPPPPPPSLHQIWLAETQGRSALAGASQARGLPAPARRAEQGDRTPSRGDRRPGSVR